MKTILNQSKVFFLPVLIWFFYNGLLMHNYGKFRTATDSQNYFRNLADSFLHGRLDIDCPLDSGCHDLVLYNHKRYLYWPPAPALVYMPIVAIWGETTPDQLIISLIGGLNVFLFSVFLRLFTNKLQWAIPDWTNAFLTLFWGMGTVHFYMSMMGSVWFASQIFAQTFLLLSLIILLQNTHFLSLLLSGLSFALACYTRNNLVFTGFFIVALMLVLGQQYSRKEKWKNILVFAIPFVLLSILNLYYNYIRFGNVFENGLQYHSMSSYFYENFKQYGYFNLRYIPYNFWIETICPPPFSAKFPFFQIGFMDDGFGFLWASPLFLLCFPVFYYLLKDFYRQKNGKACSFSKNERLLLSGALLAAISIAFVIFSIMGTGWRQFASGYSLDYQLMLIIFFLFIFKIWEKEKWFTPILGLLLFLCISINYFGARQFLAF